MLCPHCQAPNTDDARFCGACGRTTSLTEPISNPNLGEAPQLIGRVIAGRYRILAKLGEGGMGAVYQAEQISLKRTVAIKLLRPDVSASEMLLRRFNAEAEAVAKLRHPNTVNIYDFGQDVDGTLFIAMELIEGRSLRTVIHREAPLPIGRTLAIAAQVAASLSDAHAKTIIHRDLKPDNVMLTDRGRSKDNVTVLDFGIAKLRDDSRSTQHQMTQAGDMLGTPQYMAPEQIRGEPIDGRTDVYALGGMIYEMITGRLPYEAPTVMALLSKHLLEQAPPPSQRRPDLRIPPEVDDLVMWAMSKDPAARPATMDDYGERIAAVLSRLPPESAANRSGIVGAVGGGAGTHSDTPPAFSVAGAFAPPSAARPASPTPPPPLAPPGYGYAPPQGPPGFAPPPSGYGGPPYSGPPQPGPYGHGPAQSGGGSKTMWAIVALLLLGGGGAGIYFATRSKDAKPVADVSDKDPDKPDDPEKPDRPDPDKPDPWDRPDPDKPDRPDPDDTDTDTDADDPDDPDGATGLPAGLSGTPIDVAPGVKLIAPLGLPVQRHADGILIGDLSSFAIIAFPITDRSNNPDVLARSYAKTVGLQVAKTETRLVAGAMRKVYGFAGNTGGVPVVQVGVPFLGKGYRVGIVVHFVAPGGQIDPARLALGDEVFARRILLPAAAH